MRIGALLAFSAALLVAGCASTQAPTCAPGETSSVNELLYFGTVKPPGGVVSPDEWASFLATVVTPRFRQGLSVWQASGQWQSADGSLTRENSYVLNLLHPESADAEAAIKAIMGEYRVRFHQEAVLRVRSPACVSF